MNASQLRLETMVGMAADKALQLQEEIANRSHSDRTHVNTELRNQAEKIVNAIQKLRYQRHQRLFVIPKLKT